MSDANRKGDNRDEGEDPAETNDSVGEGGVSGLHGVTGILGLDPASPDHDALIGKELGDVTLVRLIGRGGMGLVYEGLQKKPRQSVAVKVMRPGLMSNDAIRRFDNESEVLGKLQHAYIAKIYKADVCNLLGAKVPYFVMEYVADALPITTYVAKNKLTTEQRLELFRKVCDAVAHGHEKGIVHRDLKPNNILVDKSGLPKVIDFGVARNIDDRSQQMTALTELGQLIGSVPYMSPEQFGGDPNEIDTRADVYALGVILYELLTGRPPYDIGRKQIFEAAAIVQKQKPLAPSKLNASIRPDVEKITGRCLQKDRSRRYSNAAELAHALGSSLGGQPVKTADHASLAPGWSHWRNFSQGWSRLAVTAASVLFALLLSVGTWLIWSSSLIPPPPNQPDLGKYSGVLYASGDDSYALYLNDKLVAIGGAAVKPVPIDVAAGDVVTVKATNTANSRGFLALLDFANDKKQIATNSATWKSYTPKNPARWFEKAGITSATGAVRGDQGNVTGHLAAVVTADAEGIWGRESKEVAYLTLTVEESSFLPRQVLPPLPPPVPPVLPKPGPVPPPVPLKSDVPGLIGAVTMAGSATPFIFTYKPGEILPHATVEQVVSDGFQPKGVRIELKGVFSLPEDDELLVWHSGGSSSGGVHSLLIDGAEVGAIGDDRTKNITYRLRLGKGMHSVAWVLNGGRFGNSCVQLYNRAGDVIPIYQDAAVLADAAKAGKVVKHVGEPRRKDATLEMLQPAAGWPGRLDLLRGIDVGWSSISGEWDNTNGLRVRSGDVQSRFRFKEHIEGSYTLTLQYQRPRGGDVLAVMLPVDSRRVAVMVRPDCIGLDTIGGIGNRFDRNATKRLGQYYDPAKPLAVHTLEITVRVEGPKATIQVSHDDEQCVAWNGDVPSLAISPDWNTPPVHGVEVGAFRSEVVFHALTVETLSDAGPQRQSGAGRRPPGPPIPPSPRPSVPDEYSGVLYASGDDSYALYLNDSLVATGGNAVKAVPIDVAVGDVVTVKATNTANSRGFLALLDFANDKKQIATNSATWKSYTPKNPARWFEKAGITSATGAVRGDQGGVTGQLAKVVTADAEGIWGRESNEVAYLTLTVEESSFLPRQVLPSLTPPVPIVPSKPGPVPPLPNSGAEDFQFAVGADGATITQYVGTAIDVTIPEMIQGKAVVAIGSDVFKNRQDIRTVVIPKTVTNIGNMTFYGCENLKSIDLPPNLATVGFNAFEKCSNLPEVTIPASVTKIGAVCFVRGRSLACISVDPRNQDYTSVDGVLYDKEITTLITCPAGKRGVVTIPASVTAIQGWAFLGCDKVKRIVIPESVKEIDANAFMECDALRDVVGQ